MLSWDLEKERNVKVWAGTLSTRVTKEVTVEKLADATRLLRSQYDVQEDSSETDVLRFSKMKKKNKLTAF